MKTESRLKRSTEYKAKTLLSARKYLSLVCKNVVKILNCVHHINLRHSNDALRAQTSW